MHIDEINEMWSPRRHHASVFFNGFMWILGGRARELVEYSEDKSVGGVIGPRVKDVDKGLGAYSLHFTSFTLLLHTLLWLASFTLLASFLIFFHDRCY